MKLRVQHEDGKIEIIVLRGGCRIIEGKHLNRVIGDNGLEHFFTHSGHYDGWGGVIRHDPEAADEIIHAMEEKREFEKASVDLEGLKKLQTMLAKYQSILEMMEPEKKEAAN